MEFYEKVVAIQRDLKAPKGQKNTFGGYRYRSCEDILEAVKPLLARENLILNISDEIVQIGDRYYIKATATISDSKTINYITATAYAREADSKKGMDPSQVTGATSSYARKYALNGLFCIDDTKDADTDEFTKRTQVTKRKTGDDEISFGSANEEATDLPFVVGEVEKAKESVEILGLKSLMDKDKVTEEQVLEAFKGKYSAVENITAKDALSLMDRWQDFIKHIKGGN